MIQQVVKMSVTGQQQQSYSGLRSPGRSNSTYFWNDSWVQTFRNSLIISVPCKHIALSSLYIVVAVVAVPDSVACIPGSFCGDWFVLSKIRDTAARKVNQD